MSAFYDRMAALSDRLFVKFGVPATITTSTRTEDFITGVVSEGTATKAATVILSKRSLRADDGTVTTRSIAAVNTSVKAGDTLSVGLLSYTVGGDVEEDNPDGSEPIAWVVTLS